MKIKISFLEKSHCEELARMVQETCKESFKFFYPKSWIDYTISRQTPERFWEKAQNMHFYVAKHRNKIVGCGAISPYFDKKDESVIVSFYVASKVQGKGVGKKMLRYLLQDEIAKTSKRIEVASSFNAVPFYMKNGFTHKNDEIILDHGSLHLEMFK